MHPTTQITLVLPYAPPDVLRKNSHGGSHWTKKSSAKNAMKEEVMLQLMAFGHSPSESHTEAWQAAEVQYVSFFCGKAIDGVEFAVGMGAALDCLTPEKIMHRGSQSWVEPGIGLLPDDSFEFVRCLPTKYQRVKHRKDVKTLMIIRKIKSTDWQWPGL